MRLVGVFGAGIVLILGTTLLGCHSNAAWKYAPAPTSCGTPVRSGSKSVARPIALEPALVERLLQQVPEQDRRQAHCWYMTPEKEIQLETGSVCEPYNEYRFQEKDGDWVLSDTRRVEIVLCHQRR
jgi:hypothetical protein